MFEIQEIREIRTARRECRGVEDGRGAIGIKDGAIDKKDTPISLYSCVSLLLHFVDWTPVRQLGGGKIEAARGDALSYPKAFRGILKSLTSHVNQPHPFSHPQQRLLLLSYFINYKMISSLGKQFLLIFLSNINFEMRIINVFTLEINPLDHVWNKTFLIKRWKVKPDSCPNLLPSVNHWAKCPGQK